MKYLTFILLFAMASFTQPPTTSKTQLIYIGDPMCSWCYGFGVELEKTKAYFNTMDFKMVMGGLRPYNTETMTDLGDFLKEHWEHVAEASGQPFNYDILGQRDFVYDTEPPSRAVLVVRKLAPEKEFDFFHAVQKAFYYYNKNTHDVTTYIEIAEGMGIDGTSFRKWFESEEMKQAVKGDFQFAANLGVRGFPTLVLKYGEEYYLISNGFSKHENIVKTIDNILAEKE